MKHISTPIFFLLAIGSLPVSAAISLDGKDKASVFVEGDTGVQQALAGDSKSPAAAARKAFESGAHEEAVKLATPLAEGGDADAIYLLGFASETGQGLELSVKKAEEYYRKGLAMGHADSAYRLAFVLMAKNEESSLAEAQAILEKQAATDPAIAGRILGEAFLLGRYTGKPDPEKAVSWWKKAVAAGDVPSMLFLARFYDGQMGFADKKDQALALEYFVKAADAGNTGAMVTVGSSLLYGDEAIRDEKRGLAMLDKAIAAKDATAYLALGIWQETVKKDSKAALAEFERGRDSGQADCMIQAAQHYIEGRGTEVDVARGVGILEKAAEGGNSQAHFILAARILRAEKPDAISGYQHLLASANGGLAAAQNELGLFYLSSRLGVADGAAAVSWFTRAAQAGDASAQNNLGALYEQGSAVEKNYSKAGQLYALAAQQGHAAATMALARFNAAGAGTEVNRPRAWALAKIAAERGETNAPEFLTKLEKELSPEQLADAKKELATITAGEAPKEPAKKEASKSKGK